MSVDDMTFRTHFVQHAWMHEHKYICLAHFVRTELRAIGTVNPACLTF